MWLLLNLVMLMIVGYGVIYNGCSRVVVIIGVVSSSFGDVLLYEIMIVDGVSCMCVIECMLLVLGVCVEFKFGGLYLMLM